MEIEELQDFIDWEIKRLNGFLGKSNEELKPWAAVKLAEEVGELQNEVLGHSSLHRLEKMERFWYFFSVCAVYWPLQLKPISPREWSSRFFNSPMDMSPKWMGTWGIGR